MSQPKENSNSLTPVWLEPGTFNTKDFKSHDYILELKCIVPLEKLSSHLEIFLMQLKQQLVDVINDNYNEFVGLGSQLSNVEGVINRSKKPLLELKGHVENVEKKLNLELKELNHLLKQKKYIVSIREKFELLQDIFNLFSKVERLINEIKDEARSDIEFQSSLFERMAGEMGKLDLLMAKGKEIALIIDIENQLKPLRIEMLEKLKSCLITVLEEKNIQAAIKLYHALILISEIKTGEDVFKDVIINPIVSSILQKLNNTSESESNNNSRMDLNKFVEEFLKELEIEWSKFINKIMAVDSGLHQINILSNCIVPEISKQLSEKNHEIFKINIRLDDNNNNKEFHENYKAGLALIRGLERYCMTLNTLESFYKSENVFEFLGKWDLKNYTSNYFNQIYSEFEKMMELNKMEILDGERLFLDISIQFYKSMDACFDKEYFIKEKADLYLKFAFMIISKFENWIRFQQINEFVSMTENPNDNGVVHETLEKMVCLYSDIETLTKVVILEIPNKFEIYLNKSNMLVLAVIQELTQEVQNISNKYRELSKDIVNAICNAIGNACAAKIKKCVGTTVSTIFRMTTEIPTMSNDYISNVLMEPLTNFLNSLKNGKLAMTDNLKDRIIMEVAKQVCIAYSQALNDLFTFWEKSRTSLQRINRARLTSTSTSNVGGEKGTSVASSVVVMGEREEMNNRTDLTNVYIQHGLDVKKFGEILSEIGVDVDNLEEYDKLKKLVCHDT